MNTKSALWECRDLRETLMAVFGFEYGPYPEERLDEIKLERRDFANYLSDLLQLSAQDVVADLGSGIGLQALHIAPRVKSLHCVDLSSSMLLHCREMTKSAVNVHFHQIQHSDLSPILGKGIVKLYATALFIHFNIYDLWIYLTEVARVLPIGGIFAFDFADADRLDVSRVEWINHTRMYREDRYLSPVCMHYHSITAVTRLVSQAGFETISDHKWDRSIFLVLRRTR